MKKFVKLISENLNINEDLASNIYEKYWEFIKERIEQSGKVEIPGFGEFELVFDEKEKDYKISFKGSEELKNRVLGDNDE